MKHHAAVRSLVDELWWNLWCMCIRLNVKSPCDLLSNEWQQPAERHRRSCSDMKKCAASSLLLGETADAESLQSKLCFLAPHPTEFTADTTRKRCIPLTFKQIHKGNKQQIPGDVAPRHHGHRYRWQHPIRYSSTLPISTYNTHKGTHSGSYATEQVWESQESPELGRQYRTTAAEFWGRAKSQASSLVEVSWGQDAILCACVCVCVCGKFRVCTKWINSSFKVNIHNMTRWDKRSQKSKTAL